MSASTNASISGTQTSAPVASRHRRDRADVVEVRVGEEDAVERHAELVDRAEQLVGLVAGSTISARSLPSRRKMKVFSATGPTVNMRTSTASYLCALRLRSR